MATHAKHTRNLSLSLQENVRSPQPQGLDDISLVEIKSGKDYTLHRAMNNLLDTGNYRFAHAYVFHDGNVETVGRTEYLPIYICWVV